MNKPSTKKTETKKNETVKVDTIEVLKSRQFKNGNVSCDLKINGITIYGVMIVEGKNGDFLSFPQRAGNDGKYYSIVWCPLDEDTTKAVIEECEKMLTE